MSDFTELLSRLRLWAGNPSLRTLAKRVGPLLRPPRPMSHTTLAHTLQPGRRRLDIDVVVAVVRALGLDGPEVDRWRDACIRVHAEIKSGGPAGVFRQLPADLATFTGREAAMKELLDAASAPNGDRPRAVVLSAIEGMGGIGKTQLAVHAAHELVRAGRFTDAQLYVNLRGFDADQPPVDPTAVLDAFLRALQVPAQQIPNRLDERAAMFRDRLDGKAVLVILDNAASADQVRDLLPASPSCLVMITSRRSLAELDGARLFGLDLFSHEECLALLASVVGQERVGREEAAADALIELTGRLPLAVALIAARLRARPAWSLAEAAQALRSQGLQGIRAGGRSLGPVLELSYQGLSDGAKATVRAIGFHPGADYTAPAIAIAAGITTRQAEDALEELVHESLARERVSGRFEVHDLVRAFAADIASSASDRDDAFDRLARWFLWSARHAAQAIRSAELPEPPGDCDIEALRFESYDAALSWLEAERANLDAVHAAAAAVGNYEVTWQLPIVLDHFGNLRFHLRESLAAHNVAVEAARARGDSTVLAWHLTCAGTRLHQVDRLDEAETAILEALELCRMTRDKRREGRVLIELGLLYDRYGRQPEAIAAWERCLATDEGFHDPRRAMICQSNIAMAHYKMGDREASLSMFQRALAAARELGERRAECINLGNVAEVHLHLRQLDEAHAAYTETHRLALEIGERLYGAVSLRGLGDTLRAMGRADEARSQWTAALAILKEIGSPTAAEVEELIAGDAFGPDGEG